MIQTEALPPVHSLSTANPQLGRNVMPRIYPGFAQAWRQDFQAVSRAFCTQSSPSYPQSYPQGCSARRSQSMRRLIPPPRRASDGSLKQRPVIAEDHAGGVVAGGAGDATAGVRAASAVVEAF